MTIVSSARSTGGYSLQRRGNAPRFPMMSILSQNKPRWQPGRLLKRISTFTSGKRPPDSKKENYRFHCDGEEPEWEIPEIPQMTKGEWTYGGRTEHEIMCHCQEIPENGADIAHLNYLHLSGPNDGKIPHFVPYIPLLGADIFKFELNNTKPMIQHCWTGSWEAGTGDMKHLGTMLLDQYLTFYGMQIPLTASKLKAQQVNSFSQTYLLDFSSAPVL